MIGPFRTERDAAQSGEVQAIYRAFDADPGAGKMHPHNLSLLTSAIEAAGVELGEYDRRILSWLAGWEPTTAVVIAGIIRRAAAASLLRTDVATALDALDTAAEGLRDQVLECQDDPCDACEHRIARIDAFDVLAGLLRGAR